MNEIPFMGKPVTFCRDGGYPIAELLTPENRKKSRERVKSPNFVDSKHKLKEIFAEIGIVVNPDAMTYVHVRNFNKK